MIHIFLINPFAGRNQFSAELRKWLSQKENFNYYVFNTSGKGPYEDIVKYLEELYESDNCLRFYCCGGSGTFNRVLSAVTDLSRVELAFFPCGETNDFLKVFGQDKFRDLDALIEGKPILIDYMETNHGRAMNSISTGVDSVFLEGKNSMHLLYAISTHLQYGIAFLRALIKLKTKNYCISIDGNEEVIFRTGEIVLANGRVFGESLHISDNYDVTDGIGTYCIFKNKHGNSYLSLLHAFRANKFDRVKELCQYGNFKKLTIRQKNNKSFGMNVDGEMISECNSWTIEVVNKGLKFVLPRGVEYDAE